MIEFADRSWLFWILPCLLILSSLIFVFNKLVRKRFQSHFDEKVLQRLTLNLSSTNRNLNWTFQILCLCFILVSLARPLGGEGQKKVVSEGIEIIFAVDVSNSMLAEDVRPSRLEQVKTDLSRLVDQLPGHRVGLVAFAGSAVAMSPLTNDPNAVKLYLDSLSTQAVSTQGTDFTEALTVSAEAFERGGVTVDSSTSVTRVILIASDGEDHEPGALEKIKELSSQGIRVFTIAYGTEKGGPIPERDAMGFNKGFKQDSSGQTVISKVDGKVLQSLAEASKGSFYFAVAGGEFVSRIVEDINLLEKTQYDAQSLIQYTERFQVPLSFAFIFFLAAWIFSQRAKVRT